MEKTDLPAWSDEEQKLLRHEAFVGKVMQLRSHNIENHPKPWWQRFLESSGAAALITVLLGGLLGQLITWSIQKGLKEREFQQAWMKSRGDQALATYKEYLDKEQETVKRAYELIGNCISSSEDLISLTSSEFAPGTSVGIEKQRDSIRAEYNKTDIQWRREREQLGLLMSYYHRGRSEVVTSWHDVQSTVTRYNECAAQWYLDHPNSTDSSNACKNEREDLRLKLDKLRTNLEAARQYAWEGWESPEKLRSILEKEK
jgi:hypothetical protein